METSGIVYRTVPRLPSTRVDYSGGFSSELNLVVGDSMVSVRPRIMNNNSRGRLSCQFSDSGHIQYYVLPRCGGVAKKKEKKNSCGIKRIKKKLRFIKRLSKDLSMLPQMAYADIGVGLIGKVNATMISEASNVLMAQLQRLKAEQKELERKLKEEQAHLKATLEKTEESSSSSSDSSDSECGKVVDMKTLRSNALKPPEDVEAPTMKEEATLANSLLELENSDSSPQIRIQAPCSGFGSGCCSSNGFKNDQSISIVEEGASPKKVEVCMGGECKKLGAAALLEEFERKVGVEATVVACKCMGKCKTAPNLRVLNSPSGTEAKINQDSVTLGINPTCTSVALQDVDLIVANLSGKDIDDECLMLSS